ncbi:MULTISPECIES: glycoside hydrolase family 30 beta sandwich domain-containing protein [unclassified Azospirillum]|uniref:glycoside hydrolase family 30 protein n=1 Tax=unclassified Azospirillum TaxID=2630922 RepID=UPI000B706F11|nr:MULTISPECIES: glycoside hydrolase family 30 beta sandwich domain-containing protein [unclassified Azospirillum]SNS79954.1 glucosylceramidase [Azospirillum sp. RU38E]SNS97194.1 glucosylceramidase [Azospirillum sp. RU37A]
MKTRITIAATLALLSLPQLAAAAEPMRAWITSGDRRFSLTEQAPVNPGAATGLPVITVDPAQRFQTMVGFGAAITDSSAWLIRTKLTDSQRQSLLAELFGRQEGGLGFSLTRLTIGASDFSLDHYSLDDAPGGAPDPELQHFSLKRPAEHVFPTVRQALSINGDLKIVASPWSAPAWMKTTGSLIKGQLKDDAYPVYARFFARYITEAAAQGVPTDYLTIQNEPDFEPKDYPGMRWRAVDRARFFADHLGPELTAQGIKTKLLDWDHNWDQPEQPLTVFANEKANGYVSGVAWHCYNGQVAAQAIVQQAHPEKEVFLTECSGGEWAPDYADSFAWMMRKLIIGSTRYGARGVLMWNLALDEKNRPNAGGCDTCRGIVTINSQTGAITRNQEYYAFGHASRFVKPGAVRIAAPAEVGDVESVAFENPDGSRVLVAYNRGDKPARFVISDGKKRFRTQLPPRAAGSFVW